MFSNIGGKIKAYAKVVCWIGIVLSVVFGILCIIGGVSEGQTAAAWVTGLLVIVGGGVASWLGSLMTYGFGQLVENSDAIKNNLKK